MNPCFLNNMQEPKVSIQINRVKALRELAQVIKYIPVFNHTTLHERVYLITQRRPLLCRIAPKQVPALVKLLSPFAEISVHES